MGEILLFYTADGIKDRIKEGIYKTNKPYPDFETHKKLDEKHVFDEEKSVKWNKEKVKEYNESIDIMIRDYHDDVRRLTKLFETDINHMVRKVYGLNKKQADLVYKQAYERGRSSGRHEVVSYVEDYADFACEIIKNIK